MNRAFKRCGITSALNLVDQIGGKPTAAVPADHEIAVLGIPFAGPPADIAGIEGSPYYAVRAFDDKVANGVAMCPEFKKTCLAVVKLMNRMYDLIVFYNSCFCIVGFIP